MTEPSRLQFQAASTIMQPHCYDVRLDGRDIGTLEVTGRSENRGWHFCEPKTFDVWLCPASCDAETAQYCARAYLKGRGRL